MADADKTDDGNAEVTPITLSEPAPEMMASQTGPELGDEIPLRAEPHRRSGFVGAALGGLIAAGAGFGIAQFVPNGWPVADTAALSAQLSEQAKQIEALRAQVPTPDTALQDRVVALESRPMTDLSPLDGRLTTLESRLTALEAMPAGAAASPAAIAAQNNALKALQAEVQALKAVSTPANVQAITAKAEEQLKQAEASAAQIKADAEALAKAAEVRAALGRLQAALDSGAPYAAVLPALPDAPAILAENAETGLPTLAGLQDNFPQAARAALEAALRANMGESWSERVTSFLRTQTGARSLEPRDGNDPDAILSRAEAALTRADLPTALAEIATLPPEAQPAMADWLAMAEKRLAAIKAVAAIAAIIGE